MSFSIQDQEGATLLVSAKFSVVSARNIYLQFQEVICLTSWNMLLHYLTNYPQNLYWHHSWHERIDSLTIDIWCSYDDIFFYNKCFMNTWYSQISLQDIIISEELQALIAPAILPRSFISLQVIYSTLQNCIWSFYLILAFGISLTFIRGNYNDVSRKKFFNCPKSSITTEEYAMTNWQVQLQEMTTSLYSLLFIRTS